MAVEVGKEAPDFELESDSGERVRLSSLRGSPVVLYFYPKDDTPGCTTPGLRHPRRVVGVQRHRRDRSRCQPGCRRVTPEVPRQVRAPFTLLADPDHAVADEYGVWQEKSYQGKTYMGIDRSTFVIGADGNVAEVMRGVKAAEHADDVLAALKQ